MEVAKHPDRCVVFATIDDALHFTPEQRQQIIASYPSWELEARTKGIPSLGSGRVFPVAEELIAIEQREFPDHWPRIGGLDFGWDHPFAAVELRWDRDADVAYLARTYKCREATPVYHCATLRGWGRDLRWSWPRDGNRQTLEGAGRALCEQYREQGLLMLDEHAQFEDGSVSVEAGVMMWLDRMKSGRFRAFRHEADFWTEFRMFHRQDGRIVAEGDDVLSAIRYALMMLRFARTDSSARDFRRRLEYGPSHWIV